MWASVEVSIEVRVGPDELAARMHGGMKRVMRRQSAGQWTHDLTATTVGVVGRAEDVGVRTWMIAVLAGHVRKGPNSGLGGGAGRRRGCARAGGYHARVMKMVSAWRCGLWRGVALHEPGVVVGGGGRRSGHERRVVLQLERWMMVPAARWFPLVVQALGTVGTAVRPGLAPLALRASSATWTADSSTVQEIKAVTRRRAPVTVFARARAGVFRVCKQRTKGFPV